MCIIARNSGVASWGLNNKWHPLTSLVHYRACGTSYLVSGVGHLRRDYKASWYSAKGCVYLTSAFSFTSSHVSGLTLHLCAGLLCCLSQGLNAVYGVFLGLWSLQPAPFGKRDLNAVSPLWCESWPLWCYRFLGIRAPGLYFSGGLIPAAGRVHSC